MHWFEVCIYVLNKSAVYRLELWNVEGQLWNENVAAPCSAAGVCCFLLFILVRENEQIVRLFQSFYHKLTQNKNYSFLIIPEYRNHPHSHFFLSSRKHANMQWNGSKLKFVWQAEVELEGLEDECLWQQTFPCTCTSFFLVTSPPPPYCPGSTAAALLYWTRPHSQISLHLSLPISALIFCVQPSETLVLAKLIQNQIGPHVWNKFPLMQQCFLNICSQCP